MNGAARWTGHLVVGFALLATATPLSAQGRRGGAAPAGGYSPLYQAGYLLGALQFRGLRRELVDSKQMTEKAFHDEILRQGSMPVALIRLALTKQKLTRDMSIDWQFYGDLPGK